VSANVRVGPSERKLVQRTCPLSGVKRTYTHSVINMGAFLSPNAPTFVFGISVSRQAGTALHPFEAYRTG
jgi:hypothetical protein